MALRVGLRALLRRVDASGRVVFMQNLLFVILHKVRIALTLHVGNDLSLKRLVLSGHVLDPHFFCFLLDLSLLPLLLENRLVIYARDIKLLRHS